MFTRNRVAATAAFFGLALVSLSSIAQDRPYKEGTVVSVSSIRTEYGRFEDYMKFLDTTWKQEQEALKKAGVIVSYQVLSVQPRGPDDPDVYLVVTYKNWAAIDGLTDKTDGIAKQIYGSLDSANKGAVDRGKMRRAPFYAARPSVPRGSTHPV
jgi:hypothetical protein